MPPPGPDTPDQSAGVAVGRELTLALVQCLNELFINRNLPRRLLDMARA